MFTYFFLCVQLLASSSRRHPCELKTSSVLLHVHSHRCDYCKDGELRTAVRDMAGDRQVRTWRGDRQLRTWCEDRQVRTERGDRQLSWQRVRLKTGVRGHEALHHHPPHGPADLPVLPHSSGAVSKWRWPSWAPRP